MADRSAKYSDFSINFTFHPLKKDLVVNENEKAIIRSLKNLIFTNPGERLFQNNIGAGIYDLLFENFDEDSDILIEDSIRETISNYEPRVQIVNNPSVGAYGIQVDIDEDLNQAKIDIYFRTINIKEPIQLSTTIKRIR